MHVIWNRIHRARWDELTHTHAAPLAQDWSYGEAMRALGARVLRAEALDGDETVAIAQFTGRTIAGMFRPALCTRGPVWIGAPNAAMRADVYRALKTSLPLPKPRLCLFTPAEERGDEAVSRAGLKRVMTGGAHAVIDLTEDEDALRAGMKGKWRNRLSAAERAGVEPTRGGIKPQQYNWLLEADADQQVKRRYGAHPKAFVPAFQDAKGKNAVRVWRVDQGRDALAAMLFLRHGAGASYHIGWTSEDGRRSGAHARLLWQAMRELKADGVQTLDLGDVDTERSPGLARFKLGSGATPHEYAGTFI